jgi:hypothetical protein
VASPQQILGELLTQTLSPVLERHPPEAIEAARRVVVDAVETIESEVLLVDPPRLPAKQSRRARSSRRGDDAVDRG